MNTRRGTIFGLATFPACRSDDSSSIVYHEFYKEEEWVRILCDNIVKQVNVTALLFADAGVPSEFEIEILRVPVVGAEGQRWHRDTEEGDRNLNDLNVFVMLSHNHESTRVLTQGGYSSFTCSQGDIYCCPSDQEHGGPPNPTDSDRYLFNMSFGGHNTNEHAYFVN